MAGLLVAPVQVGLERLEAAGGASLRGKRLGLVAHAASVTRDGRNAVDVLRALRLEVRRLFAPEHGFLGTAAAGETVGDGRAAGGLPVVSIYGAKTEPSPEDLRDLDALVIDLQDTGVRFYTYVSTMLLCLDAAAEARIEVVILDRPNPLGGVLVEGPIRDGGDAIPRLLVNMAPGPLVHGLTLGEMARYVNSRRATPARVTVVPMEGWKREMRWPDTGRTWTPPSPNLRTAEAALAYPGTCLFEGTTISEGRGTEAPFLLLGAPWLDPARLARAVAIEGFRLSTAAFIPRSSAAAVSPKFKDEACRGVRVSVTDTKAARPYRFGLALLAAARTQSGFRWLRDGASFDALLGIARVRRRLDAGKSAEEIVAEDAPGLAAWLEERRSALLY